MVFVRKKKGESKDSMFRKFTKIFIDEDVVDDVRSKLFYKKPSLLKKEREKERIQEKKSFRNRNRTRFTGKYTRNIRSR